MSSRVRAERPVFTLTKACQTLFPNRVNVSTARRWALGGVRGVVLETFVIGRERYTTPQAVDRFLRRINGEVVPDASDPQPATGSGVASHVEGELEKAGI